ncbi:MAG: hydroxylamine reductase [Bacteroidales bacterium]|nr:hydroxylamine reductase [Bacteroidales bacterium]MDD4067939.1 hydroxylamine reductase [Bacteroidales bacterium]MDD4739118.1 hydroxylamine reductase [Bacteroidales bacterium]
MDAQMFCFQCQETAGNKGCTIKGVCGKEPQTARFMDMLMYATRGLAAVNYKLREKGLACKDAEHLILDALFSTITNANFDDNALKAKIAKTFSHKDELIAYAKENGVALPEMDEIWFKVEQHDYLSFNDKVGVLSETNEDVRSLKQLIVYGVKGLAAYVEHALNLNFEDDEIYLVMEEALYAVSSHDLSADELTAMVLKVGSAGVKGMALLDKANTTTYGNPEITKVNLGVRNNPGILISGHDLKDLEELLEQTQGTGVDVYTHGEMLPANSYPFFKKYPNFVGNYGGSWWHQKEEFSTFNGPILFTTNCIVPPKADANYIGKIFTTGSAGLPGAIHIAPREKGKQKDFSAVIAMAKQCQPPQEFEKGELIAGFAHHQVLQLADKVIDAVKQGAIKKFVVMAGCDGRMKSRSYYTEFAEALPQDSVILTAGCAKYRYNKLPLGDIGGIPRVLDAGQCNDSYSLVVIALALKDAFGLEDVNQLPIVYNIAWYEQKAVIVLLALLSLGVKNIHLGPTLPAFLSPNVVNVLVQNFGIGGISTVEEDIKNWIA